MATTSRRRRGPLARLLSVFALVVAGAVGGPTTTPPAVAATPEVPMLVPTPAEMRSIPGVRFTLDPRAVIQVSPGTPEALAVGEQLAALLRPSTGYPLPITTREHAAPPGISLRLTGTESRVGLQGYRLDVTPRQVVIRANTAAGLFAGVQTLRQLLPARVESRSPQPGPWQVPGVSITDHPRFAYRGAMLDVARHFFTVEEVKRYIDQLALYKINHLHLHLSDDQGWRIEIKSWPRLATHGGSTEVGGGPGGYYTQEQYREIVTYAQERHITVVPEIDMPGHTNAALASYAELNCDGVAPPLYTGIEVGFSSLCIHKEITYRFVRDVVRELAALTPGPYLHIGGDEAHSTPEEDYVTFMQRVLPIVREHGKIPVGWHDVVKADPPVETLAQYWGTTTSHEGVADAVRRGQRVIMSPASRAYLDMKYDPSTPLGLSWAGYIEVDKAYGWNPGAFLDGVDESAVHGVEAPLWSETLEDSADIEYMAFPRLAAIAELAWSPWSAHDWESFRTRLAAQTPRWTALGVNFHPSPQVPWPAPAGGEAPVRHAAR